MSDPKAATGDKPKMMTKLSASAGEFVPSFNLHATAPSWTPPASFTPSAPVVTPPATSAPAPALAAASVPIGTKPEPQKAAAPAPPKKDAPAPAPAPASAWGKKTAASVVAAPAPAKPAPTAASVVTKAAAAPPAKAPAAAPAPAAKPAPAAAAAPTATSPAPAPAAAAPTAAAAGAAASKAPASAWGSKGGLSSAVRAAPPPMPAQPAKPLRSTKGGKDSKADKKGGRDGGKDAKGNARDGGKNKGGGRDDNRRGGKGDRKDGKGRDGGQNGKQERQKSEGGRGQKKQDAPPTEEKKADAPTPVAPAPAPVPAPAPADTKKEVTAASIVAAPAPAPAPAPAAAATAAAPAAAAAAASTAPAPTPAVATGGSWASLAKKPGVPSAAQVVQQSAPKPTQGQQRQSSQGGKGGQQHGKQHGHGQQGRHQQNQHGGNNNSGWQRGNRLPAEMCKPGEGSNDAEKAVVRHVAKDLLAMRLSYLAPPLSWGDSEPGPPEHCKWDSPTRVQEIDSTSKAPRMGGDVGQQQKRRKSQHNDTAPALEDCKPLEVNNDTRWKAGVFNKDKPQEDEDSDEVITKKALLILNKLSLTKFDKLSDDFIATGIGKNEKILHDIIWTIVGKAQDEPHFAAMYASLCLKLSQTPLELEADAPKKGKKFKKLLLERCQQEFETNTAEKIADATKDVEDEEEKAYQAGLVKKHYIGHMRFIGELYRADLITIKIMLFCLPALLEGETTFSEESAASSTSDEKEDSDEIDEEKVECFTKLMTTIGSSLEQQSMAMKNAGKTDAAEKLGECWANVERMAGLRKDGHAPAVSNRIKFMLQDLIEMRKKGWVTRRKEETAKTIAQIHKEVAKEERAAARRSSSQQNLRRLGSSGDVRRMSGNTSKPSVDKDGFVQVQQGFGRSTSVGNMHRSSSRGSVTQSPRNVKNKVAMKKVPSGSSFAPLVETPGPGQQQNTSSGRKEKGPAAEAAPSSPEATAFKTPDECGDKSKNILKEYFVGGDADDAILSFDELIVAGKDGSVDRGAKTVESAVLLVLEMKKDDVEKALAIFSRLIDEKKIEGESLSKGLNDPLEFLSDIAIDAPLASDHLASIVSAFVKSGAISLDFLLSAPDYFRTDGKAAQFAAKVLKKMEAEDDAASLEVVEKLMTCDDKEAHPSAKDLIASC